MKELFAQTEESHCSSKDNAECLESELDSDSDCSVFSCRFEYCAMCSSRNDNPSFQFCHSCYQVRICRYSWKLKSLPVLVDYYNGGKQKKLSTERLMKFSNVNLKFLTLYS